MVGVVYAADRAIDASAQHIAVVGRDVRLDPAEIRIEADRWTVVQFTNEDPALHDWEVEGPANVDAGARPSQTTSLRLVIDRPGTYTFRCTVPGHEQSGHGRDADCAVKRRRP